MPKMPTKLSGPNDINKMLDELLADDKVARDFVRQLSRIGQDAMIGVAEILTEGGNTVEINGRKITEAEAKQMRKDFWPPMFQEGDDE